MIPKHATLVAAAFLLAAQVLPVQATTAAPRIEKQPSFQAEPMQIAVQQDAEKLIVSGEMWQRSGNPSRRLTGQARIEGLDADGRSLFVSFADLRRVGAAKHSQRSRFAANVEAVRLQDVQTLKVGYVAGGREWR